MNVGKNKQGFTIVELLIVVVVIAILATITIVSFGAIQNRAHDSAVQGDLRQISKQLETYKVENTAGTYPATTAAVSAMGITVAKASYDQVGDLNLAFCFNSDFNAYAIAARAKSGNAYFVDSTGSMRTTTMTNMSNVCASLGLNRLVSGWWLSGEGGWRSWVKG